MADDNDELPLICACRMYPKACVVGSQQHQVICFNCGRHGPTAGSQWSAIKLWNNDRRGVTAIGPATTTEQRG